MLSSVNFKKLKEYFWVDDNYFYSDIAILGTCTECGMTFDKSLPEDVRLHNSVHKAWKEAVKTHGFAWSYCYRETVKQIARSRIDDAKKTHPKNNDYLLKCYEMLFKSYFSRSLETHSYSSSHPSFKEFCGAYIRSDVFFNSKSYSVLIYPEFHDVLTAEYPKSNVKVKGTVWDSGNGISYNEEEVEKINNQFSIKNPSEVDELLSKPDINELLELYRSLTPGEQRKALSVLKALKETE